MEQEIKNQIVSLRESGVSPDDIAAQVPVGRTKVYEALREAGMVRPQIQATRYVDFTPPPKHRRQPFYRAILALEALDRDLEVSEASMAKLTAMLNKVAGDPEKGDPGRVWTYNDVRGFHWLPRVKERHGDRLFIPNITE